VIPGLCVVPVAAKLNFSWGLIRAICLWHISRRFAGEIHCYYCSSALKIDLSHLRSVAMAYGAACLGLAGHSAFLAPRGEPVEMSDDSMIMAFLSSEVAREAGGALIMAQTMAL